MQILLRCAGKGRSWEKGEQSNLGFGDGLGAQRYFSGAKEKGGERKFIVVCRSRHIEKRVSVEVLTGGQEGIIVDFSITHLSSKGAWIPTLFIAGKTHVCSEHEVFS